MHDGDAKIGGVGHETRLRGSNGVERLLVVSADPETTRAEVEVRELTSPAVIRRTAGELVVLVVHRGAAQVEDRHQLAELDALVLAGDDPLEVGVETVEGSSGVSVMRLVSVADRALTWVP